MDHGCDINIVLPAGIAFVISACAVRVLMTQAGRWGLLDKANERSLHSGSKPRTGGLGILLGIACGSLAATAMGYPVAHWLSLLLAGVLLACVSLIDDLRDVPPLPRFVVHLMAAATPVLAGFGLGTFAVPGASLELGVVSSMLLTVVFVVWSINLYNFMDGMDGFAGGMTVLGFGFLGLLGTMNGDVAFSMACAVVAAAAAGFLLFNFPPARVFMGDAGAATLGFLAAAFILWADSAKVAPLWVGVMIFAPFFVDATVTVVQRASRRERIWEAHRTHYYQRVVQAGWSHRRAVLLEYGLMIGCGGSAVLIVDSSPTLQWAVLSSWLGVFVLCAILVRAREGASARLRRTS